MTSHPQPHTQMTDTTTTTTELALRMAAAAQIRRRLEDIPVHLGLLTESMGNALMTVRETLEALEKNPAARVSGDLDELADILDDIKRHARAARRTYDALVIDLENPSLPAL
jgi:hypothetical protein